MSDKKQSGYQYAPGDENAEFEQWVNSLETVKLAHRYGAASNTSPVWILVLIGAVILCFWSFLSFLTDWTWFDCFTMLLSFILAIVGGIRLSVISADKEKTMKELRTNLLKESADGILLRSRYGERVNFPNDNVMKRYLMLGYAPEVSQKSYVEGVCPNRANFRFMDITVSYNIFEGLFGNNMQDMMMRAAGEDDMADRDSEYYSWIVFRTAKRIETPLTIQSWDLRNTHSFMSSEDCFETEDTYFNSAFCCSCTSMEEAYYVLTPQLMNVLREIYTERCLAGKPSMAFAFEEDELHILLQRENPTLNLEGVKDIDGVRRVLEQREEFSTVVMLSERLADYIVEGDYY